MKIPDVAVQAAKIFLSGAVLILLVGKIGLPNLFAVLKTARLPLLALPLMLEMIDGCLRAYGLTRLLAARGIHLPFGSLAYSYMVGGFFGRVMPSSLGTDAARAVSIAKHHNVKLQEPVVSLLVLNLIGLFVRGLIAAGSSLFLLAEGENTAIFATTLAVGFGFSAAVVLSLAGPLPLPGLKKTAVGRFLLDKTYRFYVVLRSFRDQRGLLGYVLLIALVSQLVGILAFSSDAVALNLCIPISYFFLFIPIVAMGRLVPASVLGFGAEQGIFVFLFDQVGVLPAEALAVSLLQSTVSLAFSIMCGFMYLGVTLSGLANDCR